MLKDNEVVGIIAIYRQEVRPFTDKQIQLVTNFAAQAVIAIENTRLLNELRQRTTDLTEALEQQTATSEVLQVISSSPGDLEPVFATMLENAVRICDAKFGNIYRWDGEAFNLVATHNTPPALAEARRRSPMRPDPKTPASRMVATKTVVHVPDLAADPGYIEHRVPAIVAGVELGGIRTLVTVPMLKENELVGALTVYRQEVQPFTDKQIELVRNFAAQAVIAIENARLLNELRQRTDDLTESLEQQTATSEVLQVISSSPGDLKPVFEAMLANAMNICAAKFGHLLLYDGEGFHAAHLHGVPPSYREFWERGPIRPSPNTALGRLVRTKQVVQIPDIQADFAYAEGEALRVATVELAGARTLLAVPMLKERQLVGAIVFYRQEVRPFTDKQIELVHNFASQAVIAIENTRLLNELRESLQQQTATSEVLQVISSSPGDLEPVFATMLENAVRICDAKFGNIYRWDGDTFNLVATLNTPPALVESRKRSPLRLNQDLDHMVATKAAVHVVNLAADERYVEQRDPITVASVELGGIRTLVAVPMLKDNELIGVLTVYRQEVRPFTDKQIELVQNFAAQAVIAIENTRLLNELRESLQQQTATADVLKVVSRSTFDLQTVLDTLTASAARLCDADFAFIFQRFGDLLHLAASHGFSSDFIEYQKQNPIPLGRGSLTGRTALEGKIVHIPDVLEDPEYTWTKSIELAQYRTMLGIPLSREGVPIGVIALSRRTVRPFTDRQIELMTTFADQAVIAIENVRLFDEVQKRTDELTRALEQQTATAEVLPGRGSIVGRVMLEGRAVQISDVEADPEYEFKEAPKVGGVNTLLGVPLLREGSPIGVMVLQRLRSSAGRHSICNPCSILSSNPPPDCAKRIWPVSLGKVATYGDRLRATAFRGNTTNTWPELPSPAGNHEGSPEPDLEWLLCGDQTQRAKQ